MPNSPLLASAIKAQLHKETALAIFDGSLKWGDRKKLAQSAGISDAYFSRLRHPDPTLFKPPSYSTAKEIALNTPLPREQQQDLLHHLILADEELEQIQHTLDEDPTWVDRYALTELTRAHDEATYARVPSAARHYYQALITLGQSLLTAFYSRQKRLAAARTHTLLQDAYSVLNRPGEGLYHAKVAGCLLKSIDDTALNREHGLVYYDFEDNQQVIDFDNLSANAIRIEAACYHALGDDYQAITLCEKARTSKAVRSHPEDLLPHVLRDQLNSIPYIRHASLVDIEKLAQEGQTLCEKKNDGVGLFLILRSTAKAYVVRKQVKNAEHLFDALVRMSTSTGIGQLHQAMLWSELAAFHHWQGNERESKTYAIQTIRLAQRGGFAKILHEMTQAYGWQFDEDERRELFGQ